MTANEMISKLHEIVAENGNIDVCVHEYAGGDYELRNAVADVDDEIGVTPVVLIQGRGSR